jgi:hypothetical protein
MIETPDIFQPVLTPEQILDSIDEKFESIKGKEDRLSLKWGHFSRGMNVEIREYTKKLDKSSELRERYHYVQIYWTCKSRLLDLHMRHRLLGQGKIRRENKMAKDIKKQILSHQPLRPVSENDLLSQFLGKL